VNGPRRDTYGSGPVEIGPRKDTYGPGPVEMPDAHRPNLPEAPAPSPEVGEDRFYRELPEVVAWQELGTALFGMRKIADLLGVFPDGWDGATVQQIGDRLTDALEAALSEDATRSRLFAQMNAEQH
jgi:hypothetical protein